ncbi:Platelet-activating factor acetylhydrolase [Phytophthora pseudosyringae]|uniref:Platelet-activating factor acetylhydrolase n=1 Tax=Phytophthora pseudosyringae TaxID=221518 RepID=A0A8T1WI50_9STRA|nr:Platelet-activating factor acetylhydrolase [Phytophthora pseudosyringae]
MDRHVVERVLLGACTCQWVLEFFCPSAGDAASIAGWCVVSLLLALHSPRRELAPLYASLGVRVLRPLLPSTAATFSFWSALDALAATSVALAWASSLLFPWPDFSRLHGPHQTIGCRSTRLGSVECRVFYPSASDAQSETGGQSSKRPFAPYLHHGSHLMTGLGVFAKMPAWLFHNMSNAHLAALQDAPPPPPAAASDGWPVVIFSHGLAGSLELYSYVNQELASHGHVVVVPNHCDGSACVCSPEPGRIEYYQQITPQVRDDIDGAGFRFRNGQLQQRVSEVRAVLDAIQRDAAADSVFSRCDLANVSIAGHSFGAATALSAAHQDARFQKMVLLDAWMEPLGQDVRDGLGPRVPALHLMSEHFLHWRSNAESTERHARGCTHAQSRLTWLRGTRHNNFSDIPVFSPTLNRLMKSAGKIDHLYALEATSQLSAAFLAGDFDARAAEFPELVAVTSTK